MLFSRAILAGCLSGLKWLLWLVAGLVLVLIAAKWARGEAVEVGALLAIVGVCAAAGYLAGLFGRWMRSILER